MTICRAAGRSSRFENQRASGPGEPVTHLRSSIERHRTTNSRVNGLGSGRAVGRAQKLRITKQTAPQLT